MTGVSESFANKLRIHAVEMAHYAHESHVASALSSADIVAVLYTGVLNIDPHAPDSPDRDRFVLSKGHGCSVVYAALAEKGFFPIAELNDQCQDGSRLSGHITCNRVPGVEFSTGSLGHGCCVACGMALAAKLSGKQHRVFTLMGDGECNEGSVWEMAQFAVQYQLSNFCIIIDHNKMQAMGDCKDVLDPIDLSQKWRAFGWKVCEVDGHDHDALKKAFAQSSEHSPICIIAHTIKGKGVSFMEHNILWHYRDPQGSDYDRAIRELQGESV